MSAPVPVIPGRFIHVQMDNCMPDPTLLRALRMARGAISLSFRDTDYEAVVVRFKLNVFVMEFRAETIETFANCVRAVRGHDADVIRLSPIIAFVRKPTRETIRHLLGLGVDDIVLAALGPGEFWLRLKLLLAKPMEFFETTEYFGPDRRRGLTPKEGLEEGRIARPPLARFFVERSEAGCRRLTVEEGQTNRARPAQSLTPNLASDLISKTG